MKKILGVLTTLLLLFGSAALAEGAAIVNPNHYDLLLITDIFTSEETQDYAGAPRLVIQGTFGTMVYSDAEETEEYESDCEEVGFDRKDIRCVAPAEGCEILLPADPRDPTEYVEIEDLQAWYDNANAIMAEEGQEDQSIYEFYVTFEMNDDGELTKMEYMYFDWM